MGTISTGGERYSEEEQMEIGAWKQAVNRLLAELPNIDFGYPLGVNRLLPPRKQSDVELALRRAGLFEVDSVREFYLNCDGLSLPDIHVGYFIKSADSLPDSAPESEPNTLLGRFAGSAMTLGSTGGGELFVIQPPSNRILLLPLGPLHCGVYDGNETGVRQIAVTFERFLGLLLEDIRAFVEDHPNHTFIV